MIYVVGDIHGCYYTLVKLINHIKKLDVNDSPEFVFVGDYVDRGLHSDKVIDYLIKMQADGAMCLRGNHDDVVDWLVNQHTVTDLSEFLPRFADPNDLANIVHWWNENGLSETLDCYNANVPLVKGPYGQVMNYAEQAKALKENMPDDHKEFLKGLPLYWENETHFACHAYMRPNEPLPRDLKFLPQERANETLWNRFPQYHQGGPLLIELIPVWDKIGIFGHTPTVSYGAVTAIKHHKIRLIDTYAFGGEYLTAYCCERDDFVQVAYELADIDKRAAEPEIKG